ncbi:hypothetical protein CAEBREN_16831 [Caenorhabditis brenneri]|uniref:Uncharacterized protein n=1 Tax=Caenorhabditis brenneri TaxID=135651 RepID=G0MG45_CAEBE|nr:hypothetical protein CAEBREN_16831 [Caenorhabditis brenneri]
MVDKQKENYKHVKAPTHEEQARCVEQSEICLTKCLIDAHFVRMAKEVRELQNSYEDLNMDQRKERLLKINGHLQEILKERPVLTSSDYDAMDYHTLISRKYKFWSQMDQIKQLDPSVNFYFADVVIDGQEVNDEKKTEEKKSEKSCWEKLKGASAELVKKIVKKAK